VTSLLPRHGFLLSNPFPGADGASPSNFCGGRGLPFETRSGFRYERGGRGVSRGQSRVFTRFGLEERHGFLLSNPFSGADGASPSNFCGGRGLPFETRSGFRYERGGRGVSRWRARGQSRVFTCFGLEGRHGFLLSNPFSGADGASPSNFCGGRGLPFETRSGFRYERDLGS
jgi:hypothetical protein